MQTRTLASRASSGWLSWRTFLPIIALLAGLGDSFTAAAQVATPGQSTANIQNVVITAGPDANTATTNNYDAIPSTGGTGIGGGIFAGTNFGSLDATAARLLLQGGTVVVNEVQGETYNNVSIKYGIAQGTTAPSLVGTIQLQQTGFSGSQRTFALNNAAKDILALATTAGTGTTYRFDISVTALGIDANGDDIYANNTGSRRRASFAATGIPFVAPTVSTPTVLIAPNNGTDVSYDINNSGTSTSFNGATLGTFDINTGKLLLNGGTATTRENNSVNVSSVTLYYRVIQAGTGGGAFSPVALAQTGVVTNTDGSRTRTFSLNAAGQNLLSNVNVAGNYNVELYLQTSGSNGSATFNVTDNNNGSNYVASFVITGTAIVTVVWTGGVDDNWFNPNNWNPKQIPTATTNARIPDFPSGSNITYPNIYSGVVKQPVPQSTTTNSDGTINIIPATPGYDNTNSGNAMVRDLTMSGTSPTQRSILRLIVGRLDVFGDFNNTQQSFIQRASTVISFKSQGNQTISGNTNGFTNVEIDGAAGSIKTLSNAFSIKAGGSLKFINGILQTDISQTDTNYISFDAATTEAGTGAITPAGRLLNETNDSFFRGYLITTQTSAPGTTQDFSNIGLTTTFTGLDPGPVFVSRNTAGNYAPTAFGGSIPKPGIRRVFGVQPNNPGTNTASLNAVVKFAYLDNELVNLRVNTTNPPDYSGSVDKTKLALYVSTTGGNSFSQLGRDSNDNNVLVKSGVTTFATFTLSEQQTPLPVKLIAFDAKRTGSNALITWATAVEISNSGFEVQVSTDGVAFRKLAFLASQAINSTSVLKYSFLDDEANKTGTRYYRLRQIDEDGKDDFSPVRVVSFSAASANQATTLTSYPNPFTNSDLPVILVQAAVPGDATLQVIDMMGRVVTRQAFTTVSGIQEVSIPQASNLSSGVYMAKVTLATGEVKTIRIQKR